VSGGSETGEVPTEVSKATVEVALIVLKESILLSKQVPG
jgi:hypothetical protein